MRQCCVSVRIHTWVDLSHLKLLHSLLSLQVGTLEIWIILDLQENILDRSGHTHLPKDFVEKLMLHVFVLVF